MLLSDNILIIYFDDETLDHEINAFRSCEMHRFMYAP